MKKTVGLLLSVVFLAFSAVAEDSIQEMRRTPVVEVAEKVRPAVVNISTERIIRRSVRPPGFRFFGFPFEDNFWQRLYRTESLGSGVIVDPRGYVVTNAHVISQASRVVVALLDGREFEAELIGADPQNDIAILKIRPGEEQEDLKFDFLPFGPSDDLMIGETAIAIGNPQGLGHTVTVGVISAVERKIQVQEGEFTGLIQTDAAINPGNSGGPLVNILGQLIGINMAMANAENIGFAIPAQRVSRIFDEFVHGIVSLVDLMGLEVTNIPRRVVNHLQLPSTDGVIVTTLIRGGYGEQYELQPGDAIVSVDGKRIQTKSDYNRYLTEHNPEEPLVLEFIREGETREVRIKLPAEIGRESIALAEPWFGIVAVGIDSEVAQALNVQVDDGVLIHSVEKDSSAERAGLRPGDIILAVGRKRILSIGDYRQARALLEGYRTVQMRVRRGRQIYTIELSETV